MSKKNNNLSKKHKISSLKIMYKTALKEYKNSVFGSEIANKAFNKFSFAHRELSKLGVYINNDTFYIL